MGWIRLSLVMPKRWDGGLEISPGWWCWWSANGYRAREAPRGRCRVGGSGTDARLWTMRLDTRLWHAYMKKAIVVFTTLNKCL